MAIEWKDPKYGSGATGYAGKLRLFRVSYSVTRHEDGKMHVLGTTLPFTLVEDRFGSDGEARAAAEAALEKFLKYVARHTGRKVEEA